MVLRENISIFAPALRRLKRGAWPMLVALAIAEVVAGVVLAPLGAAAVNWLIRRSGCYAIANDDLVAFALSPLGITTFLVVATVGLTVTGLGRAAALLALEVSDTGQRVSGVIGFTRALACLPKIVELAARQTCLLALIGAPFLAVLGLIAWLTLKGVDMYWVVTVRPTRFWVAVAFALPPLLCGGWLVGRQALRWSIALPLCVLCGRSARAALSESAALLHGRLQWVAGVRLTWLALTTAVGVGSITLVQAAAVRILQRDLGGLAITAAAAGVVLLAYAGVGFVISLIALLGDVTAVHAAWMTFSPRGREARGAVEFSQSARNSTLARLTLLVVLGVGSVGAALAAVRLLESVHIPVAIEVTAHRGAAREAPENTLAAIDAAIALGVDRVEFDVMQTADGALVLFHDTDLRRIVGDPRRIANMTLDELRDIDVGSWFGTGFAGERIPTLDEAIERAHGRVRINAELKAIGDDEELARRVAAVFETHGSLESEGAIITSLSTRTLAAIRRKAPGARIGLIVTVSMGNLRKLDVDLLVVESGIATDRFIQLARRAGLPVQVWGVTNLDQFVRLTLQGVEGVISSDPGALLARREELMKLTEAERLLLVFRMRVLGQ